MTPPTDSSTSSKIIPNQSSTKAWRRMDRSARAIRKAYYVDARSERAGSFIELERKWIGVLQPTRNTFLRISLRGTGKADIGFPKFCNNIPVENLRHARDCRIKQLGKLARTATEFIQKQRRGCLGTLASFRGPVHNECNRDVTPTTASHSTIRSDCLNLHP